MCIPTNCMQNRKQIFPKSDKHMFIRFLCLNFFLPFFASVVLSKQSPACLSLERTGKIFKDNQSSNRINSKYSSTQSHARSLFCPEGRNHRRETARFLVLLSKPPHFIENVHYILPPVLALTFSLLPCKLHEMLKVQARSECQLGIVPWVSRVLSHSNLEVFRSSAKTHSFVLSRKVVREDCLRVLPSFYKPSFLKPVWNCLFWKFLSNLEQPEK